MFRKKKFKKDPTITTEHMLQDQVFGPDRDRPARLIFAFEAVPGMRYLHPNKNSVVEFSDTWNYGEMKFTSYHSGGEILAYNCRPYSPIRVDDPGVKLLMDKHTMARDKLYGSGGTEQPITSGPIKRKYATKIPNDPKTGFREKSLMHLAALKILECGTTKEKKKECKEAIGKELGLNIDKKVDWIKCSLLYSLVKKKRPEWWEKIK